MQGWIKLHRSIVENEFYESERFTKALAWIDLLLLATHKGSTLFLKGQEIRLRRGQVAWSQKSLAQRWKWNERTVKRFLGMLRERGMIRYTASGVTTIITICNYDFYQGDGAEVQSGMQNDEQRGVQTNKNVKNEENVKNKDNVETIGSNGSDHLEYWGVDDIADLSSLIHKLQEVSHPITHEQMVSSEQLEQLEDLLPKAIEDYGIDAVREKLSFTIQRLSERNEDWNGKESIFRNVPGYLLTCLKNKRKPLRKAKRHPYAAVAVQ